jgi:hypothetical protein
MKTPDTPFDSIESSLEYVGLLAEAIDEARSGVDEETTLAAASGAGRRVEALKLVALKLDKLGGHVSASRRILNDLRTLRRLLLDERAHAARRPSSS